MSTTTFVFILGAIGFFWFLGFMSTCLDKFGAWLQMLANATPSSREPAIKEAKKEMKKLASAFAGPESELSNDTNKVNEKSHAGMGVTKPISIADFSDSGLEQATETLTVTIGRKAVVYLRYYASSKTIARHLVVNDTKLQSSLGKRGALSPIKAESDWLHAKYDAIRNTRLEVNKMIDDTKDGLQNVAKSSSPKVSVPESSDVPMISNQDSQDDTPPDVPENVNSEARKAAKGIVKGVLHWHGVTERTVRGKTFKHYRVDYLDDETKIVETIWGEDLKRAVSSCRAKKGDKVEIFSLAKKRIDTDKDQDQKRFMNRWHIVVLERNQS